MGHTSTSVNDFWTEPIILWIAIVLPTGKDSGLSFKKIYFKYNSGHYKLVAICIHVLSKNISLKECYFYYLLDVLCYDDACHFKKRYAQNPVRKDARYIARKMATMDMVCDRFHFVNHTDKWNKKNCNPYKTANLEVNNNCVTKGNNI